jgi:hypothetical protein
MNSIPNPGRWEFWIDRGGTFTDIVARRPDISTLVLECTNMPPYARAVAQATGRPVYDVVSLLNWLWSGVSRGADVRRGQAW